MSTTIPEQAQRRLTVRTRPFDFGRGGDFPGDRGVVLDADTGFSGAAFSPHLPSVFLTENGEIDLAEIRVPLEVFLEWVELIRAASEAMR